MAAIVIFVTVSSSTLSPEVCLLPLDAVQQYVFVVDVVLLLLSLPAVVVLLLLLLLPLFWFSFDAVTTAATPAVSAAVFVLFVCLFVFVWFVWGFLVPSCLLNGCCYCCVPAAKAFLSCCTWPPLLLPLPDAAR